MVPGGCVWGRVGGGGRVRTAAASSSGPSLGPTATPAPAHTDPCPLCVPPHTYPGHSYVRPRITLPRAMPSTPRSHAPRRQAWNVATDAGAVNPDLLDCLAEPTLTATDMSGLGLGGGGGSGGGVGGGGGGEEEQQHPFTVSGWAGGPVGVRTVLAHGDTAGCVCNGFG